MQFLTLYVLLRLNCFDQENATKDRGYFLSNFYPMTKAKSCNKSFLRLDF